MAKNDSTNSENILVKVDQNNLIYIDPNSVLVDGVVQPRETNQENLVFYLNLEADLVPRTTLNTTSTGNTLTSIAKGTFNVLQNKNGDYLDTSWTDLYTNQPQEGTKRDKNGNDIPTGVFERNVDNSGQSFGISSVRIDIKGANFVPYVNINFIDVRGKTLFENPDNSPYGAFFHLPWPIFYLTVKGYYGKAIRYRLHLISFNTSYNDSNGNFESNAKFVGSTYAYLNDIPLTGILNAPYMYGIELPVQEKTNDNTGRTQIKLAKSSRGYQTLLSVYEEYRRKGLITIPEDQNPTLRELIMRARRLDQILERQIFGDKGIVEMKLFGLVKEFEDDITSFYNNVNSWLNLRVVKPEGILNKTENNETTNIVGNNGGTLELIIKDGKTKITKNQNAIRELLKNSTREFKTFNVNVKVPIGDVGDYYDTRQDGKIVVDYSKLLTQIEEIQKSFEEEKKKLQTKVEEKINEIVNSKGNDGLGFEPTIRNVFGVLLANADTYIRLLNNVHFRAYNVGVERSQILLNYNTETVGKDGAVYPWPEITKPGPEGSRELVYPAHPDLVNQLGSDNPSLWPEIEFVEEFMGVSQKITDNLAEKERTFDNLTFSFDNSETDESEIKKTSMIDVLRGSSAYSDKTFASIIYEMFERVRYGTLHETFDYQTTLNELGNLEFKTLQESVKEDYYLVDILREIKSIGKLKEYLASFSPFERYPYFLDGQPTTPYLKDVLSTPFTLTKVTELGREYSGDYTKLSAELLNYDVEDYRLDIYPFNSTTYLGYQFKNSVTKNDMSLNNVYKVTTSNGLISTDIEPSSWLLSAVDEKNLFSGVSSHYQVGNYTSSVFNTPYFHKTLYEDFFKTNSLGKYKSSAYLLLNSLPFLDLDQDITTKDGGKVKISNMFKEVGSRHSIPYHLIAKWGSIYHRYKTYLLDGVDIMSNITTPIDGAKYFDNNLNLSFSGITRSTQDHVGIHPYYSSIYHQVVNDYLYYNVSDTTSTSFESAITNNVIHIDKFVKGDFTYYNSFVDNSRFDSEDKRYTILPSHGTMIRISSDGNIFPYSTDFNVSEQFNFITDWSEIKEDEFSFSGVTFPSYNQYLTKNKNNRGNQIIDIDSNNKKVIDLIATFSPEILNEFEQVFLKFASERIDVYEPTQQFEGVVYDNFQNLLKALLTVEKEDDDDFSRIDRVARSITSRQVKKQENVTKSILSTTNLLELTILNPKGLDLNILYTYSGVNQNNRSTDGEFQNSQLIDNAKYIELYVGEDLDGYYSEFFNISDIELNEDNVLSYKFLLHIYGGWRKMGNSANKTSFIQYLNDTIILPHSNRESSMALTLISNLQKLERTQDKNNNIGIRKGYGDQPLKLENYSSFKLFNDRWTSGNSIGQRLLMEEFIFLDQRNKDIGNDLYFDVQRLIGLDEIESQNLTLYGVIGKMLARNNLDLRALPAYVNLYGNISGKKKVKKSNDTAQMLFGKFLEVDVEDSKPTMVIQYVGRPSNHMDVSKINRNYKFRNDGINLDNTQKNPLLITDPTFFETENLNNSNRVAAFEVSFGDQNQGIFKSIRLDQSQFKETKESMAATEATARSESGAGIRQVDTQLYDIYKTRAYTCEVTAMGNVMIQPTMYFQLKNVPLFEGAYWILEVSHNIENNGIQTTFSGQRISEVRLPDPTESFTASYRVFYDKIMNSALKQIASEKTTTTDEIITTEKGTFKTDKGPQQIDGEKLVKRAGVDEFSVPYNGFDGKKTIQLIEYNGQYSNGASHKEWYRTIVSKFDGPTGSNMALPTYVSNQNIVNPSKFPFTELVEHSDYYYRLDFHKSSLGSGFRGVGNVADYLVYSSKTDFLNPMNGRTKTIDTSTNSLDTTYISNRYLNGPADIGSSTLTKDGTTLYSGIAMSPKLMKDLRLTEGDVIYFKIR